MGIGVEVFRSRRVLLMWLLGFSSGLPLLLTGSTLSAWLATSGMSLSQIGILSWVGLPYALKIVWAPLLDRFTVPLLGRRRGWMLAFQAALCVTLLLLSLANPRESIQAVAVLALSVAFLSASQDIVTDAYRSDLLEREERAAGTAVFVLGYRIAMLLTGGLALIVADHWSWQAVYAASGLAMAVGMVTSWCAPEPAQVRPPSSVSAAVIEPLVDFFRRPGAITVLLFVTLYRVGDTLANVMVMPFLLSLQFGQSEIGVVYKVIGIAATILGTLVWWGTYGAGWAVPIAAAGRAAAGSGQLGLCSAGTDRKASRLARHCGGDRQSLYRTGDCGPGCVPDGAV
jgi:PAT family beta-lactamase induction signal transducer AmpG